jgi:RimJ/RimL family protein N-acetyltransferase
VFRSCRKTGLHIVKTRRLWIVSARRCDLAAFEATGSDPAAQRWLGWPSVPPHPAVPGPVDLPLRQSRGILLPKQHQLYFAGIDRKSMHLVTAVTVYEAADGYLEIGGHVAEAHRGRGLGTEALVAACDLAHHHFGIATLRAGCETTNVASIAWLRTSGFTQIAGPATHRLPGGREIQTLWWSHSSPRPRLRCLWISRADLLDDGRPARGRSGPRPRVSGP